MKKLSGKALEESALHGQVDQTTLDVDLLDDLLALQSCGNSGVSLGGGNGGGSIDVGSHLQAGHSHNEQLAYYPWPQYEEAKCVESTVEIAVQVNGKAISTAASTHLASS